MLGYIDMWLAPVVSTYGTDEADNDRVADDDDVVCDCDDTDERFDGVDGDVGVDGVDGADGDDRVDGVDGDGAHQIRYLLEQH